MMSFLLLSFSSKIGAHSPASKNSFVQNQYPADNEEDSTPDPSRHLLFATLMTSLFSLIPTAPELFELKVIHGRELPVIFLGSHHHHVICVFSDGMIEVFLDFV